jgi:hypothetical protein
MKHPRRSYEDTLGAVGELQYTKDDYQQLKADQMRMSPGSVHAQRDPNSDDSRF